MAANQEELPIPPNLPPALVKFVSDLYKSACNEWTGEKHFEVKPLKQLLDEDYEKLKQEGLIK